MVASVEKSDGNACYNLFIVVLILWQGDTDPFIRNVFTLNTCAPIAGSDVRSFDDERDMLQVWTSAAEKKETEKIESGVE